MLARGARLTALECYLSTEREHFWQQEFEISLTAPKLSLVGFSAEYKDAILSSDHLRLGFSAEVSELLHRTGKAQLHERCWTRVTEEPQIIIVHVGADRGAEWETVREPCLHPDPCCLPQSMQKWTVWLLVCRGIPQAVLSGFGEGEGGQVGNRIKGMSCLAFSYALWHACAFISLEKSAKSSCRWLAATFPGLALVLQISICILLCRCERVCVTSCLSWCIFNFIVSLMMEKC